MTDEDGAWPQGSGASESSLDVGDGSRAFVNGRVPLAEAVRQALARKLGVAPADSVVVAFSGGVDSTVLLALISRLRAQGPIRAVHFDHRLHRDSGWWAEHCREVCSKLGISLVVRAASGKPGKGESVEAWAREARYAAFAEELKDGEWLLTAHHRQDQAETLLLQLLRGAGIEGLAGMPWVRALGRGRLGRPLLRVSRQELQDYLHSLSLPWLDDPANFDSRFDRNRIRHMLLPALAEAGWPEASIAVARSAENLADVLAVFQEAVQVDVAQGMNGAGQVVRDYWLTLSGPRQRELLRAAVRFHALPMPSRARLEVLAQTFAAGCHGQKVQWEGGWAWLQGGRASFFTAEPLAFAPWQERSWRPWLEPLPVPGWRAELRKGAPSVEHAGGHALDARFFRQTLLVKKRRGGERYCNLAGRSRPLKKLLMEQGVVPEARAHVPLLVDGEGEVLAVLGVATCGPGQARVGSGRVLWIEREYGS